MHGDLRIEPNWFRHSRRTRVFQTLPRVNHATLHNDTIVVYITQCRETIYVTKRKQVNYSSSLLY